MSSPLWSTSSSRARVGLIQLLRVLLSRLGMQTLVGDGWARLFFPAINSTAQAAILGLSHRFPRTFEQPVLCCRIPSFRRVSWWPRDNCMLLVGLGKTRRRFHHSCRGMCKASWTVCEASGRRLSAQRAPTTLRRHIRSAVRPWVSL